MLHLKNIKNIFSTKNIIPIISLTIIGFIFLVVFIFFNYSFYLSELEEVLGKEEIESKKMQLNSELMELARSRTRLTSKIIDTTDIFEQDALNQELEVYANRFANLRQKLISLPLSKYEKTILNEHAKIIKIILPAQRRAVNIAMHKTNQKISEAQEVLYNIVLPGQKNLIDSFQKLIEAEQRVISKLSQENLVSLKTIQKRNKLIISVVLVIVITLSVIVIIRINSIQNNLYTTHAELEKTNIKLEQRVAERTKELSDLNKKLKNASEHDELTNIYNRRKFNDFLINEYVRTKRLNSKFALIMIDIDYFKQFNDTYGHKKGDDCLVAVASAMSTSLPRSTDFIARYGGEEFVVILPSTDINGALTVAENLRKAVHNEKISHKISEVCPYVTISLGLTVYHANDDLNTTDIINNADQCLYAAKAKGRNQLVSMS